VTVAVSIRMEERGLEGGGIYENEVLMSGRIAHDGHERPVRSQQAHAAELEVHPTTVRQLAVAAVGQLLDVGRFLHLGEARAGERGDRELLQRDGRRLGDVDLRVALGLAEEDDEGFGEGHRGVVEEAALDHEYAFVGEPGVLMEGRDPGLVHADDGALGKWRLRTRVSDVQ